MVRAIQRPTNQVGGGGLGGKDRVLGWVELQGSVTIGILMILILNTNFLCTCGFVCAIPRTKTTRMPFFFFSFFFHYYYLINKRFFG